MHEIGLCEALLDAVEKRAAGRQVTGVRVRIGTRHRVAEPALTQGFELIAAGSVADGAAIELVTVPGDEFVLESITVGEGNVPRDPR
ncbi:MAG: hydrogenase nickel incorporation protein HypA/HybF [Streptosporangiaceae bacterium]|jgi:Zn finger protein HypA/HybF involved in hydrogenase expression|nr:hydrogenase expression/synthesis HypA [Streptosporangiaceae bacterium]MDX6428416.1 hydrogenase nickel incorporation protein HypA/HybF [Streptosporangiaceae bacterium]